MKIETFIPKLEDQKLQTMQLFRKTYFLNNTVDTMFSYLNSIFDITLLCQGLWEPEFYSELVYKLKKFIGSNNV